MSRTTDEVEKILAEKERQRFLSKPVFTAAKDGTGRYKIEVAGIASLEVDVLRRESGQLKGELVTRCHLAGARVFEENVLDISDINISSRRTREQHAAGLAKAARTGDGFSWEGLLEEFAQRILIEERKGSPSVNLRLVDQPEPDEVHDILGFRFPSKHPTILFGDGGTAKSILALYYGGCLARDGARVGFFDWELGAPDHRDRLGRLFPDEMPEIQYARCSRALLHEAERLRKIVATHNLNFLIFDSIAFACHGKPEDAEIAAAYFQILRQFGSIGSLHIAHVAKSTEYADQKPLGSVFWHNGARSTWNVKLAEPDSSKNAIALALHNRKSNLSSRNPSIGLEIRFLPDRIVVAHADIADTPELAAGLSIQQRMTLALRSGAKPLKDLAAELDTDESRLRRNVYRYKTRFTLLDGGRIGLLQR